MISRAQQRRLGKAQPAVDRVTESDARFFERFPDRNHRVRLAATAELEQNAAMLGVDAIPATPCARWIVLVKQIAPGVRMRAFAEALTWSDLDVSENEARELYDSRVRPGTYLYEVDQKMQAVAARIGGRT